MIYDLVDFNDPILRTNLGAFDFSNPPVNPTELVTNLLETMNEKGGIGLSANQVGLPYRVFVMRGDPNFACFNPRIVDTSNELMEFEEGCLTFPGMSIKIKRPRALKLRFAMPNGEVTTKTFSGLTADCVQHEISHLNGEFFFDGIGRLKMERIIKEAKKLGRDYTGSGLMKFAVLKAKTK